MNRFLLMLTLFAGVMVSEGCGCASPEGGQVNPPRGIMGAEPEEETPPAEEEPAEPPPLEPGEEVIVYTLYTPLQLRMQRSRERHDADPLWCHRLKAQGKPCKWFVIVNATITGGGL